jgi:PHD/YefM family antitoxin component YafN of YafNO toxin-antitoxin module
MAFVSEATRSVQYNVSTVVRISYGTIPGFCTFFGYFGTTPGGKVALLKMISAGEARSGLSAVLDDAEEGKGTMIIRNSRETAAVIPAHLARFVPLIEEILCDLGESVETSQDPEILEAYRRGMADLEREDIEWYEV